MRRSVLLSLLLMILGIAHPLYPANPLGFVADKEDQLTGGKAEEPARPLPKGYPITEGMRAETQGPGSGALFTIGQIQQSVFRDVTPVRIVGLGPEGPGRPTAPPPRNIQGAVTMGSDSRIVFNRAIVNILTGRASELDFWTELGQFRFVFFSRPKGPLNRFKIASRQVKIKIFNPKSRAEIDLYGTDVQVHVAPDGAMSVFVAEGFVRVRKEKEVRVRAGEWTYVGLNEPPTPPAPFGEGTSIPGLPVDTWGLLPDPPSLSPRSNLPRDLPKAGPP